MKQNLLLFVGVVLLGIFMYPATLCANGPGAKGPLVVTPSRVTLQVGKTVDFKVRCTEEKNAQVQEHCTWLVVPDSLGQFHNAEFEAKASGSGVIMVTYKNYSDTISVSVISKPGNDSIDNKHGKYPKITFEEKRIDLNVGESQSLSPVYRVSADSSVEVEFTWSLRPVILGTLSADGTFLAEHTGHGKITACYNDVCESINVHVKHENGRNDEVYPALEIATKRVNIKVGEYVELMAVYADSAGEIRSVTPEWHVTPEVLGHFTDSLFYADSIGKGYIVAAYAGLTDSIPLNVQPYDDKDNLWSAFRIVIEPSDTIIAIGDSVQYSLKAYNKNNWHMVIDSTLLDSLEVEWSVVGHPVGDITESGMFTATQKGFALIKAKLNGGKAVTTRVLVDDAISDSTGINTAEIRRVLPNGNILPPKTVREGSAFKIGGLPYPLNLLNGGLLYFPVGSLKEDISIFMMLPDQIIEDSTGVVMIDSVFAGIKFVVTVGDSIIEPYYFEEPLVLSIPYKVDLLDSLGINPEEIGMFFSEEGDYTQSGIENVVVDTINHRITADVVHFSTFVVRKDASIVMGTGSLGKASDIGLINSPNPFISETTIRFTIEGEKAVTLLIYDLSGKIINQYPLGKMSGNCSFQWDATNKNGAEVKPGIYVAMVMTSGKKSGITKMVKLK